MNFFLRLFENLVERYVFFSNSLYYYDTSIEYVYLYHHCSNHLYLTVTISFYKDHLWHCPTYASHLSPEIEVCDGSPPSRWLYLTINALRSKYQWHLGNTSISSITSHRATRILKGVEYSKRFIEAAVWRERTTIKCKHISGGRRVKRMDDRKRLQRHRSYSCT